MDRLPAREQHLLCKNALVGLALFAPHRFVELCANDGAAARLTKFWETRGDGLAPEERCPSAGLSARALGPTEAPVVIVTFPVPERPNEAFFVEALPVDSTELAFRVFGLEKAVWPKTGQPLTFVVEWDGSTRRNYGPPSDARPNDSSLDAFAGAILDILDGKRQPLATSPVPLPRPESEPDVPS